MHGRSLILAGTMLACAAILAWTVRASLESSRATYETQLSQLAAMQEDARVISSLRTAPKRATDRQLPHDELVAEIEEACSRSSMPATALASIWPESPRRLQRSDYQELPTRVSLERVSLQQLTAFAYHLQALDSSLTVNQVRLTARKNESAIWDAELTVAYLLYAPRRAAAGHHSPAGSRSPDHQTGNNEEGTSDA